LTGTDGEAAGVVTELKTIPQMRSTQTAGIPVCTIGSIVLVAHGIVSQSVAQLDSMMLPTGEVLLPVKLNDMAGTIVAVDI
jgi:hypothetical protein